MKPQQANSRALWIALLLFLAGKGPCGFCDESSQKNLADLAATVDKLFAKWNRLDSPGCAVGIVREGKLIYNKGFGSANLDYQVPNTPQTVFDVASFSKSFTCICLALLMDEGKIAPEDDLRKFIPEMHAFEPPIRIQDMVRCRSGLWDQVSIPILIGWENAPQQVPHTAADFFSLITGQKRVPFKPGTEFRYSSGDYFLLGVIIKRLSGQSLAEFARKRVFEPLGMKRTYFEEDPTRVVEDRAAGHYKPKGDAWHLWRPTASWVGGGGVMTCVDDLYRWDQSFTDGLLPRGKYLDEFLRDGTLLGNRHCLDVDAYFKETDAAARRDSPPGQYRGVRRRQYTGGAWGYSSAVTQFPEQRITIICLSNNSEIAAWSMTQRIADLLLAGSLKPQAPNAQGAPDEPAAAVKEADLRDKVGAYRIKSTGQIWRITFQDGTLTLTDHLLKSYPLRALSATRFDPEGPFYASTRLVFSRNSTDKHPSLVSQWNEPDNRGSLEFEAVKLVEPTAEQLLQYVGEYVSDELDASYRLTVREQRLWLRVNSRRWEQLDATVRDEFIPHIREPGDGRILRFLRNDRGEVTALAADYYRVNGVRFAKR